MIDGDGEKVGGVAGGRGQTQKRGRIRPARTRDDKSLRRPEILKRARELIGRNQRLQRPIGAIGRHGQRQLIFAISTSARSMTACEAFGNFDFMVLKTLQASAFCFIRENAVPSLR